MHNYEALYLSRPSRWASLRLPIADLLLFYDFNV